MSKSGKSGDGGGPSRRGGVQRDAQGNVEWKWVPDPAKGTLDSTSRLLQSLDAPDLKIQPDAPPASAQEQPQQPEVRAKGYDPYGRSKRAATGSPPVAAPRKAPARKPSPASSPQRSWLSRLLDRS